MKNLVSSHNFVMNIPFFKSILFNNARDFRGTLKKFLMDF
jgi:hypothetical protein